MSWIEQCCRWSIAYGAYFWVHRRFASDMLPDRLDLADLEAYAAELGLEP